MLKKIKCDVNKYIILNIEKSFNFVEVLYDILEAKKLKP
jgi:hypothetical protein